MKTTTVFLILILLLTSLAPAVRAAPEPKEYVLTSAAPLTDAQVGQLKAAGANITYVYKNFGGAAINISPDKIAKVSLMPFVSSIEEDGVDEMASLTGAPATDAALPGYPYNLDLIDEDKKPANIDGSGVWIAVLDSGFYPQWQDLLNKNNILTQYAMAFNGPQANSNKNQWDAGSSPHGTAVTSVIIGFRLVDGLREGWFGEGYLTGQAGTYWVPGVAPGAKIIPVKVCESSGCWRSDLYAGIDYVTSLKKDNPDQPIILNYSSGSDIFHPLLKEAADAAIKAGVVFVSVAGNCFPGDWMMGFPGAYEPVIAAAAGGWINQWHAYPSKTWWLEDVPERTEGNPVGQIYVADWSCHQMPGQYQDVVTVGSNFLVPWTCPSGWGPNSWKCSGKADPPGNDEPHHMQYGTWSGTSYSAPTIAGMLALMLQVNPTLNNSDATFGTIDDPDSWGPGTLEKALEAAATPIPDRSVSIVNYTGDTIIESWKKGGTTCNFDYCDLDQTGWGWVFVDKALEQAPLWTMPAMSQSHRVTSQDTRLYLPLAVVR